MPRARVSRLSWVRFFPEDFLGGTQQMDCRQVGQYILALCAQWGAERGAERTGLRTADGALKATLRGEELDPTVRSKFEPVTLPSGTFLRNRRMSLEIADSLTEWEAKVKGGVRTAERTAEQDADRTANRTATTLTTTSTSVHPEPQAQPTQEMESSPTAPQKPSASMDALRAVEHWQRVTDTTVKSQKVRKAYLKRADERLKEGATLGDLIAAVDHACADDFYVQKGYHKQPAVVWKDHGRVQQLAAWRGNGTGQKGYLDVMAEGLALGSLEDGHDDGSRDNARLGAHGGVDALAEANQSTGLQVARPGVGSRDGGRNRE